MRFEISTDSTNDEGKIELKCPCCGYAIELKEENIEHFRKLKKCSIVDYTKLNEEIVVKTVYDVINDPDTLEPFYIGKGCGNRAFSHLQKHAESHDNKDLSTKIAEIRSRGKEPRIDILRYGMSDSDACKLEGVAIDLIGIDNLTNKVRGFWGKRRYESSILREKFRYGVLYRENIKDYVSLVRVDDLYSEGMSKDELYGITTSYWHFDKYKARYSLYVLSVYKEKIIEVYRVFNWMSEKENNRYDDLYMNRCLNICLPNMEGTERFTFSGCIAEPNIREYYYGKCVESLYYGVINRQIRYYIPYEETLKRHKHRRKRK